MKRITSSMLQIGIDHWIEQANDGRESEERKICAEKIYDAFKKNVHSLDLRGHGLTTAPDHLDLLKNLEYLDLRDNNIEYLPTSLRKLTDLKLLLLQGNPLISIPDYL
jgi:Leucine-rich repeat (LRR) protein